MNEGTEVGTRGNEAVRLRAALRRTETRHRSVFAKAAEERDEAIERAAELTRELERLTRVIEDLERQLEQRVEDATHLRGECARLENQWQLREDELEDDHRRMLAEVAKGHERELLGALEQRDAAIAEAERADEGARIAALEAERLTRELAQERRELDELLMQRTAEGQRRYEAALGELEKEQRKNARREAPAHDEMAAVLAQHDAFIAELLESHERDLTNARRERDATARELEVASRQLAEIEATARRRKAVSSAAAQRELAMRWAATAERIDADGRV